MSSAEWFGGKTVAGREVRTADGELRTAVSARRLHGILDVIELGQPAYAVISGNAGPVEYDPAVNLTPPQESYGVWPAPGIRLLGWLSAEEDIPVIAFSYPSDDHHGGDGSKDRVVAWTGVGYGNLPDDIGRDPAWYIIGAEIGRCDPPAFDQSKPGTGGDVQAFDSRTDHLGIIATEHFSMDLIRYTPETALPATPAA